MKLGKCDFRIQGTSKRRESSLSSPTSDPEGKQYPHFLRKVGKNRLLFIAIYGRSGLLGMVNL